MNIDATQTNSFLLNESTHNGFQLPLLILLPSSLKKGKGGQRIILGCAILSIQNRGHAPSILGTYKYSLKLI